MLTMSSVFLSTWSTVSHVRFSGLVGVVVLWLAE
jgi:hypothetical protein